jgi:hypothetical protein
MSSSTPTSPTAAAITTITDTTTPPATTTSTTTITDTTPTKPIIKHDEIPMDLIFRDLNSPANDIIAEGVRNLRKIFDDTKKKDFIDTRIAELHACKGLLVRLVDLLDHNNDEKIVRDVARVLTNVAAGTTIDTVAVVDAGAVPKLISAIKKWPDSWQIRDESLFTLANIAGESLEYRKLLINQGIVNVVLDQILDPTSKLEVLRSASFLLMNLVRGNTAPNLMRAAIAISTLLLDTNDVEILENAGFCLYNTRMVDRDIAWINAIIDTGCVPRLFNLVSSKDGISDTPVPRAAMSVIYSLSHGNETQVHKLLDLGLLDVVSHVMKTTTQEVLVSDSLSVASWIAETSRKLARKVGENETIMTCCLQWLNVAEENLIRADKAWGVVYHVIDLDHSRRHYIASLDGIRAICKFMSTQTKFYILREIVHILSLFGDKTREKYTEYRQQLIDCNCREIYLKVKEQHNTRFSMTIRNRIDEMIKNLSDEQEQQQQQVLVEHDDRDNNTITTTTVANEQTIVVETAVQLRPDTPDNDNDPNVQDDVHEHDGGDDNGNPDDDPEAAELSLTTEDDFGLLEKLEQLRSNLEATSLLGGSVVTSQPKVAARFLA